MNRPTKELDLHDAYAYHLERKALRDQQWAKGSAESFADLLTVGHKAQTLENLLHVHLPYAPRAVVFADIGSAITWPRTNLAVAQLETRLLSKKLWECGVRA